MAVIGILAGQIYRSDLASLKSYRIPPSLVRFSSQFLAPVIGSMRPPRRLNRAMPDESRTSLTDLTSNTQGQSGNEEVITTARPSTATPTGRRTGTDSATAETGSSVVREWVNELTGRTERENAGIRVPSEAEINQLTSMFPDFQRQVIIGALQRRYVIIYRVSYPISQLSTHHIRGFPFQPQYRSSCRDFIKLSGLMETYFMCQVSEGNTAKEGT